MKTQLSLGVLLLIPFLAGGQPADSIRAVEGGLRPPYVIEGEALLKWSLADRMAFYKIPTVSIAVIRNGKIEWAKAYGVIEKGQTKTADTDTLFQAASISKPVAATAAMTLVERGAISLDEDVNGKLKSWKVPGNEFTKQEKVTLRRLVSHSAGIAVHGFPGYAADAPVPSLVQVLNGETPANTAAIRVEALPGSKWNYSGGGFTIMQQLVIDLTRKPFPDFMRETVLVPFGMKRSAYQQPLSEALSANAARAYQADGSPVPGRWHTYPEMAAAGLWTTPSDLARFAIEIRKAARGESNGVLKPETATAMLTRQKDDYGLGLGLSGEGTRLRYGHGGSNKGYQCNLQMYLESGDGIAVMANSDAGGSLVSEVMRSAAAAYGWPDFQPVKKKIIHLEPTALASFAGVYKLHETTIKIHTEGGKWWTKTGVIPNYALFPDGRFCDTTIFWKALL